MAAIHLTEQQLADIGPGDPLDRYKGQHVSALCADLDLDCDQASEYAVRGRDATLIMRWYGNQVIHDASALQQVGGAIAAVAGSAARIAIGQPIWVSREVLEERVATCGECPTWDAERARCRACGCVTAAKARLIASACPLGRWPA
jgi:hypothetical protein